MHRFAHAAIAAATLVLISSPITQASAAERAAMPRLALAEAGASGQRAIDLLGQHLDAVAAHYRKTPEALRELLLRDPLVRLDRQGKLYVVEELQQPLEAAADTAPPAEAPAPLDQTFKLHSKAGSKRTIYLDFNGATLTNTAWNSNGNTIVAQPFDSDGAVNTNFSNSELERIQYIWQRVSEDYAPFDVDVTTEEPSADKITRSSNTDDVYGTTALITNTSGVYNCSCGGVAYIGVYDNVGDFYKPALVFWNMLGPGSEKYVAEAISHEVGHNIGLNHDGYSGGGYYPGHGSGETGWAPIMGVGYYQPTSQWSKGEYNTANNTEDDFVVAGSNGMVIRADDHGNNRGAATALTANVSGSNVNLSGKGIIETRADKDFFSFSAKPGAASITISPDSRAPNLDVLVKIQNSAGKVIAKGNPETTLGVTVNFNIPTAGKYYVIVNGVGYGDPLTNGYTDYGSLGQYTVTGTAVAP